MARSYVLDSSILVASLIPSDDNHEIAFRIVQRLLSSNDSAHASAIVPVEVCAAVARRTREQKVAEDIAVQLKKWVRLGKLKLAFLNSSRMNVAQEIAAKHYIRGMDAIVVQVAVEKTLPFLTFDQELARRISPEVRTMTNDNVLESNLFKPQGDSKQKE